MGCGVLLCFLMCMCWLSGVSAYYQRSNPSWLAHTHHTHTTPMNREMKNPEDALEYLTEFGYISKSSMPGYMREMRRNMPLAMSMMRPSIRKFQQMAHIPINGRLDSKTYEMMNADRCGCPDVEDNTNIRSENRGRWRRFVLHGTKWERKEIFYNISQYSRDLPREHIDREIARAFKFWTDVADIRITPAYQGFGHVDIDIRFVSGSHGDGAPLSDGPGKVLAHAFAPYDNAVGIQGDAHFDEAETWTINTTSGANLLYVAVHEFGHSLGLRHSEKFNSIMYPFSRNYDPNLKLYDDDIQAIQTLYGPPRQTTTTAPPTPPPPPTIYPPSPPPVPNPDIISPPPPPESTQRPLPTVETPNCRPGKIDAITLAPGLNNSHYSTYAFRGNLVFKLRNDPPYGVDDGFPKPIQRVFGYGAPNGVDAALYIPESQQRPLYLFKGSQYWKYLCGSDRFIMATGYPKEIERGWRLPLVNIDAAFLWGNQNRVYFIQGNRYYRHTLRRPLNGGRPKSIQSNRALKRVPGKIEAAMKWKNGRNYFFVGNQYYYWTRGFDGERAMAGPFNSDNNFFGCGDQEVLPIIASELLMKPEELYS